MKVVINNMNQKNQAQDLVYWMDPKINNNKINKKKNNLLKIVYLKINIYY